MKRKILILAQVLLLIILCSVFWSIYSSKNLFKVPSQSLADRVVIKNTVWNVKIADTDQTRESGLSNIKSLEEKTGMFFVFDTLSSKSFWMKEMFIPIDMIFIDDKWRIVLIESNLQPNSFPKIFGSEVLSQYVLEINAEEAKKYDLKVGDQVILLKK